MSIFSALVVGIGTGAAIIAAFEYRHRPRKRTRIDASGCPDILTTYERRP